MTAAAVGLALVSALCFAFGSALEQRSAKQERPTRTLDPRLLLHLLRRPMWLFGWAPDAAGSGLQALALHFGPLALVEPLLVSGLFLAIPLESGLNKRRAHARDYVVVALGVVGLAVFLASAQPRAGVAQPSTFAWVGVAAVVGVLFSACLVGAWRARDAVRGTLLGVATGMLYAVAASLLKTFTSDLFAHPFSVLNNWQLYALIVVGVGGLTLNQNAFQSGPIAAPLAAVALVDPVASTVIAVTAFHERLSTGGPRVVIDVIAALAVAAGIWLASTTRSGRDGVR